MSADYRAIVVQQFDWPVIVGDAQLLAEVHGVGRVRLGTAEELAPSGVFWTLCQLASFDAGDIAEDLAYFAELAAVAFEHGGWLEPAGRDGGVVMFCLM